MAAKKVGTVIREAREKAGISQDTLARRVTGVSAAELKRVEAGEADFTQAQLKAIAKALGVTQTSLLNAPKNVSVAKKPLLLLCDGHAVDGRAVPASEVRNPAGAVLLEGEFRVLS